MLPFCGKKNVNNNHNNKYNLEKIILKYVLCFKYVPPQMLLTNDYLNVFVWTDGI